MSGNTFVCFENKQERSERCFKVKRIFCWKNSQRIIHFQQDQNLPCDKFYTWNLNLHTLNPDWYLSLRPIVSWLIVNRIKCEKHWFFNSGILLQLQRFKQKQLILCSDLKNAFPSWKLFKNWCKDWKLDLF